MTPKGFVWNFEFPLLEFICYWVLALHHIRYRAWYLVLNTATQLLK